ncbi:MAG: hypothetical protein CMM55_00780 [Rhodospirillaceae bacterium]|nr:hypothetical protein [Rhodospirillaceae bacterium]|tara:strand:- start:5321 stop:6052 length:732 start_codon:yes stop_codon:yes gene_type:complete
MIVSINQPAYLPWLGYFDRIDASDTHIVLDHVQFEKNSFINRNKIRTPHGWTWLTIPVATKGKFGDLEISGLEISNAGKWNRKHWNTLKSCYARAPYFSTYYNDLQKLYSEFSTSAKLGPVLNALNDYLRSVLGLKTDIQYSSALTSRATKSELVLSLCKEVGADTYLSGPLGRNYLDRSAFEKSGINVRFHDYIHPHYEQNWQGFEVNMSTIDVLANVSCGQSSYLMRAGRQISDHWSGKES